MRIQIINGPNINLLGKREPSIYGSVTFEDYLAELRKAYKDIEINYFQSNIEGEMIDCIQQVGFDVDGIILNAGAYTHTSIALQDAIRSVTSPVPIEGAIETIDVDEVIVSVGVSPNPLIPRAFGGLEVSKKGTIVVEEDSMRSTLGDVYAGGDIVRGGATVILAMGDGRKAAAAMDADLKGKV